MPHDLTFVAPQRRDEVLRRIDVIESFLRQPGPASAEQHARLLGLRKSQFYTLAKAWKESRRPEAIAGAGQPKDRRPSLSPDQVAAMDLVIAENAAEPARDIVRLIMERFGDLNAETPPQEVVTRYVARSRPRVLPIDLGTAADLIVDHTVLDLPMTIDGPAPLRPVATLVIDSAESAVVGLALSGSGPGPGSTAAAILDALRHRRRSAATGRSSAALIARPAFQFADWEGLDQSIRRAGLGVEIVDRGPYQHGGFAEALLGRRVGGIVLRPRLVSAPANRRISKEVDPQRWLSASVASELARGLIVGKRTTAAFSSLDDAELRRLDDELADQADLG